MEMSGAANNSGYVNVTFGGKTAAAHRLAYALHYGEDPSGKVVMHTCDNRRCVNPLHLRLGTLKDNTQDMVSKGRAKYVAHPGAENGRAKLGPEDVVEVRRMIDSGMSNQDIAAVFGCTHQNINRIRKGLTWACLLPSSSSTSSATGS